MGNLCLKNTREPPQSQSFRNGESKQCERMDGQQTSTTSTSNPDNYKDTQTYNQYKDNNVVEQMKSKKINTKRLCRPSKVIPEQSSVHQRDTEHIASNGSNYSGYYENIHQIPNLQAAISLFLQNNSTGKQVRIGDTVIIRNLKDHYFLFCKYQKLKKYDKQNLVKLENYMDEANEMYLTWKFKSIHPENQNRNMLNLQLQENIDGNQQQQGADIESIDFSDEQIENNQCVKIQHLMTGCYLQSNKNYRHDPSSKVNNGHLVSGGPYNRITSNQQWIIELVEGSEDESMHINTLFRIKHTDTNTYLTSLNQEVCTIKLEDLAIDTIEESKNDFTHDESRCENSKNETLDPVNADKKDDEEDNQENSSGNPTDLDEPAVIEDLNAAAVQEKEGTNGTDLTPTTINQSKDQLLVGQNKKEIEIQLNNNNINNLDIRRSDRCSIDSAILRKPSQKLYLDSFNASHQGHHTYIDENMKSCEQLEIANLINDEAMSENGESLFKLKQQQFLNEQINNDYYKMNNYTQQLATQEKEQLMKKKLQFLNQIQNGDIWYVSDIIESNE